MEAAPINGHAPTLEHLQEQRKLLEAQLELRRIEHAERLLESLDSGSIGHGKSKEQKTRELREAYNWWYDSWDQSTLTSDIFDRLRDVDGLGQSLPPSVPSDRRGGSSWPIFRTEIELARFRQTSRVVCEENCYAQGLLRNICNYVVGPGGMDVKIAFKGKKGQRPDESAQALIDAAQQIWDSFAERQKWVQRQQETFRRVNRDGEAFLRFFAQDDGTIEIRFVEPECIRQHSGHSIEDGWSFGIRHKIQVIDDVRIEDVETEEEYCIVAMIDQSQVEYVPAADIVHVKSPHQDLNIKRGVPAFILGKSAAFERAAKLQRNLSAGGALQAAIAWIRQSSFGTQTEIANLSASSRDSTHTDPVSGKQSNQTRYRLGSIIDIPAGIEYKPAPWTQGTQDHLATVQGDVRMAATAFSAPEFLASADASNANYASTLVAAAPFTKSAEGQQNHFREVFKSIVWRVLRWAVECGKLAAAALQIIDVEITAPKVLHEDELQRAQIDEIGVRNGWQSVQDAIRERGKDPEQQMLETEEYQERFGQQGQGLGGMSGEPSPGGGQPPGGPPQPEAGAFSLESIAECDHGENKGKPGPCPHEGGNLELEHHRDAKAIPPDALARALNDAGLPTVADNAGATAKVGIAKAAKTLVAKGWKHESFEFRDGHRTDAFSKGNVHITLREEGPLKTGVFATHGHPQAQESLQVASSFTLRAIADLPAETKKTVLESAVGWLRRESPDYLPVVEELEMIRLDTMRASFARAA